MGFFNYEGPNGDILSISPYIWLYFAVTIVFTSVAFGIWYMLVKRRQQVRGDVEKQAGDFIVKKPVQFVFRVKIYFECFVESREMDM
ncbi:hypothetical protein GGR57DRAFT_455612 [Xylariaceae sp. FL1272]|nr:hypothetical protein GGR57DRAFT_455612 [Xylariaceae sp. FL1272]